MKNLTRVLALVLVLAMTMSTVAFASFTDVAAGDDYAEAIEMLAAVGILKGYEDGSFGADKAITRAEAVAIVNRIQGLQAAAVGSAGASLYADVAADHWALGDINLATQMGIVSGDGDGNFRPDAQVSYQEMVKMLCCALGYQPAAADLGGWPTGYLVVANDKDILDDTVNTGAAPANRGVVAQLTYNALTAPLMAQTGYGSDKKYEFKDEEGKTETLLSSKLKVYKFEATPATIKVDDGVKSVNLTVDTDANTKAFFGVKVPTDFDKTMLVGNSKVDEKLDYPAVIYAQKNADKDWEVLYCATDDANTEIIEYAAEDITVDAANDKILVVNEDADIDEKYTYDANTIVYIDGEKVGTGVAKVEDADLFKLDSKLVEAPVEFAFIDDDEEIDIIYVKKFKVDVVSEISASGKNIMLKKGTTIKLDTEDNDKLVYTLKLDGKDVTPADLKEGDVVTYISRTNYYEIIVTRDVVEGEIEAIYEEDSDKFYTIAGEDYEASVASKLDKFVGKVGAAGSFYLDAFGKIVYSEKTSSVAAERNYGYITAAGKLSDGINNSYVVDVLDVDGNIQRYTLADKINLSVIKATSGKPAYDKVDTEDYEAISIKVADDSDDKINDEITKYFAKGELIDFSVNTDGLIKAATVWNGTPATDINEDDDLFAYYGEYIEVKNDAGNVTADNRLQYSERNARLSKTGVASYYVTEDTVVFAVYGDDADEYAVTDINIFDDEDFYGVKVYDKNDDGEVAVLLLTSKVVSKAEKENLAVFSKVSTVLNEKKERVQQVTFYKNGEEEAQKILCESGLAEIKYTVGEAFTYETNSYGEITKFIPIIKTNYTFSYPTTNKGVEYVYGQVYDRTSDSLTLGNLPGTGAKVIERHKKLGEANVYIVDKTTATTKISVGSLSDITGNRYNDAGELIKKDYDPNFIVLIKYVDGVATDVVAYKNSLPGTAE